MRRIDLVADGSLSGDTVCTGFPSIDRWLGGGVRAGDLVVLGGDVGSGKSALSLAMALRMAETGVRVGFLTGEMSVERVMERALAIEGRVKVDDLRQGRLDDQQRASVGAAAVRLRDQSPRFEVLSREAGSSWSLSGRTKASQVVIVDSLQALATGTAPRDEELAALIYGLKAAAVAEDVCVIVTAQLPALAERNDARPTLDDFGTMGAVKQVADVVLALYREEMYAPDAGVEGATELLVRKNRNGTTGYVDLYFYKQWLRFEDMLDPDR
jgi:replicative DNA helicase